jgi:murein DD-endopeptidase MepM/ murein hydrolase activator NlpD
MFGGSEVAIMNKALHTLLFTNCYGGVRSIEYHPQRVLLLVSTTIILLICLLLYSGIRVGVNIEEQRQLSEIHALQQLSLHQQQAIDSIHSSTQASVDDLTLRLGRMQAQVLRLDALGQRLVSKGDLDAGEFDFNMVPPIGGPEESLALSATTLPDFTAMLNELEISVADREKKLGVLEEVLLHKKLKDRVTPSGKAVERGVLSSKFGTRIDPFTGKRATHKGVDIAGKAGSNILALGDGVVTWSGTRDGYGNLVEIDHGDGLATRYGHNTAILVNDGDTVRKGQPVALMGSTGRSTGPHVHIEVLHEGKQVNPASYLEN